MVYEREEEDMQTTIAINVRTWKELLLLKNNPKQTFDDVILDLINQKGVKHGKGNSRLERTGIN